MSADLELISNQPDHIADPPGQPLPNARRFVNGEFSHSERSLLVHQGGMFFSWNGACWPAVDDAELRAQLYAFFDKRVFCHETKTDVEIKPFAPNRYKIGDLPLTPGAADLANAKLHQRTVGAMAAVRPHG